VTFVACHLIVFRAILNGACLGNLKVDLHVSPAHLLFATVLLNAFEPPELQCFAIKVATPLPWT
jgi:hypothetical protein